MMRIKQASLIVTVAAAMGLMVSGLSSAAETAPQDMFLMKDGKVVTMKGDKATPMDKEITTSDGTKVGPDGRLTKNGKKMRLMDGMGIDMTGHMRLVDGIMMKGGKAILLKGDKGAPLDKEVTMANGTKVTPDGWMMIRLEDGMMMNMKGEMLGGGKKKK